ncbi:MAG: hypothetical protein K0R54_4635 [Clostridiaceae bacterium]|jgi:methyl-accepting chemotaxis protein|nr:hypothetical protein [Clostridiaceae bacterium]
MWIALLIIGVLLIVFNIKAINEEKSSFSSKLQLKEEDLTEVMMEIGQLRQEFAETLLTVQQSVEEIKTKVENLENKQYNGENTKIEVKNASDFLHTNENESTDVLEIKENLEENNVKINEVEALLKENISIEEISKRLNIGKGEVLLIKDLYLK